MYADWHVTSATAAPPVPARNAPGAWLVRAIGTFAATCGVLTFVGWALDIPRFTDWDNDGISMFPNAALCAVLSGLALVGISLHDHGRTWTDSFVRAMGALVGLLGMLTLFEHFTGINLGID